ncbi:HlyD family type I secretion periplasmic adaptor subunit [Parashewanella spongiae]|nr:HlyD family type I secretion periplasmic adaptor subunit [Parashewanella spongiae]MCL1077776.1 HlyD family type I secretion periplasmic adaptor subunit [Parashewanella spongiae]
MLEILKKYRELWKAAKEHYDKIPDRKLSGNELEFLPAAVEILETPASPIGRTVSLTILALFSIAVLWAWFGKIDIEAVAQGKIIPQGQVKSIQALEIGKVEQIYVTEGQKVKAGQALIKLDPTDTEVDVKQVKANLLSAQLNAFRIELLLSKMETTQKVNFNSELEKVNKEFLSIANKQQIQLQNQQFYKDLELFNSMKASLAASIKQQQATIESVKTDIQRLKELTPLFTEQEKVTKKLRDKGHVSYVDWLAYKEKQVETSQNLKVQASRLEEAKAKLAALKSSGVQQDRQFHSEKLKELGAQRKEIKSYKLTLTKAEEREQNRYLTAPVSGTVQQLQVHTLGGVIQAAQPLMVIVPENATLEVEAMLLNKDVGFIHKDMHAEIKIESFPYTRYGLVDGTVRHVSNDSVEQKGIGRVYPIRVSIEQTQILVDNRHVPLQSGMSVTVEIKTGKRRLLEYFLAPFLKYQDESLKER